MKAVKGFVKRHWKILSGYGLSFVLHALFMGVMTTHLAAKKLLVESKPVKNSSKKILIDLKDLSDLAEEVAQDTPFISQKNRALKGALTEEKGVLVYNKRASSMNPLPNSIKSPADAHSNEGDQNPKDKQVEVATKSKQALSPNLTPLQKVSDAVAPQHKASLRELVTKTTLQKFNVNLQDDLQVGSLKDPNALFYLEFSKVIKQRFLRYIKSSPLQNVHYVRADSVSSSGRVLSDGTIEFEAVVVPSKTQPYFNYLAERIIDRPGKVEVLPQVVLKSHAKVLYFNITLLYTGPPEYQWWCDYHFYLRPHETKDLK